MLEFLVGIQNSVRSALGAGIDAFAATNDVGALATMLPMAIVFGIAHALTPGHSKSVLAAYAVGSTLSRLRALLAALALATTHVGMAVILALVANTLVTRTIVGAGQAPALEMISRGLLVAVGGWLIIGAFIGRPHLHGEGILAGVAAGLIPCPLTLFLMFFATSRGVPEAGLVFAFAMVVGVGAVLSVVAMAGVLARDLVVRAVHGRGIALSTVVRAIDALAGTIVLLMATSSLTS